LCLTRCLKRKIAFYRLRIQPCSLSKCGTVVMMTPVKFELANIETSAKSASMINVPFHRIAILTGKYLFATVRALSALSSRLQQTFCSRSETPERGIIKLIARIKVFANFGHKTRSQTIKTRASAIFPHRDLFAGREIKIAVDKSLSLSKSALTRLHSRRVQLMSEVTKSARDVTGGEKGAR
jgi:hypothetical protein